MNRLKGLRNEIFQNLKNDEYVALKLGEEYFLQFSGDGIDEINRDYKLSFTGEMDISPELRTEAGYPILYRRLSDSLEEIDGKIILHATSNNANVPQMAYYKVYSNELKGEKNLQFSCAFKLGDNAQICNAHIDVEIFLKGKEERYIFDNDADIIYTHDLKHGNIAQKTFELKREVDFLLITIALESFVGDIYIQAPKLIAGGLNVVEEFKISPLEPTLERWLGENFSRLERPAFEITLNDRTVFSGESFERIYRYPAHEIRLPKGSLNLEVNTLKIKYVESYKNAPNFILRDINLIITEAQGIVSCPKYVSGSGFSVVVKCDEFSKVTASTKRNEVAFEA